MQPYARCLAAGAAVATAGIAYAAFASPSRLRDPTPADDRLSSIGIGAMVSNAHPSVAAYLREIYNCIGNGETEVEMLRTMGKGVEKIVEYDAASQEPNAYRFAIMARRIEMEVSNITTTLKNRHPGVCDDALSHVAQFCSNTVHNMTIR